MNQPSRSSPRHQRGFGFLEVLISMTIASIFAAGTVGLYMRYLDRQMNQSASEQMAIVSDAASQYIKDNYQAVSGQASGSAPAVITIAMLRNTGYLPAGFSDLNSYGQDYQILARKTAANQLQTLVVTRNGDAIKEIDAIDIAKRVGAKGGYISKQNPSVATGSFGGWSTSMAPFNGTTGAGHLATALFFQDGAIVNDYLYRNAIPGQPNLNRMNTNLDMGNNSITNAASVYANGNVEAAGKVNAGQDVNAGGTVTGGTVTSKGDIQGNRLFINDYAGVGGNLDVAGAAFAGDWFRAKGEGGLYFQKYGGGWYMTDPTWLRSYNNRNVYTAGEMRGGTLTSEGRTVVGEYLQLNGTANENWGCSPDGLVSRNPDGILLCKGGRWTKQSGSAPTCTAYTINGYDSNDATTWSCPAGYTKTGWDTGGQKQRWASTPGLVVGQNDYATVFCCKF